MSSILEPTMVAVDGTDALAFVIVRPGSKAGTVAIESGSHGLTKAEAALVLRHVADRFDPEGAAKAGPAVEDVVESIPVLPGQLALPFEDGEL